MPRPRLFRKVLMEPRVTYFKPAGVRMVDLEESILAVEEFEAVRWNDLEGLEQEEAASKMGISQPTFHRLLSSARKKIVDAIVNGKALRIEGGSFKFVGRHRGRHGRRFGRGANE
ncbi:MAG: DUF134 domain-containing protein [Candidatus Diapherotrites archaeon]